MSQYTKYIDADNLPWHVTTTKLDDDLSVSKLMVDWEDVYRKTPAADVAPIIHAYWIEHGEALVEGYRKTYVYLVNCSNCGRQMFIDEYDRYCPNCGARMDGEKE